MTPCQKIKREILLNLAKNAEFAHVAQGLTEANLEERYLQVQDDEAGSDWISGLEGEFRSSGDDTGLPCEGSRHYSSRSVGRQLSDGSWVGWTYWFGGGKHGCSSEIEWMQYAYELEVTEKKQLVTVRVFTKNEGGVVDESNVVVKGSVVDAGDWEMR